MLNPGPYLALSCCPIDVICAGYRAPPSMSQSSPSTGPIRVMMSSSEDTNAAAIAGDEIASYPPDPPKDRRTQIPAARLAAMSAFRLAADWTAEQSNDRPP